MKNTIIFAALLLATPILKAQDAEQLVAEMVTALGGKEQFLRLGNVTLEHHHHDPGSGLTLTGRETYEFAGERSHAVYTEHSLLGGRGRVVEGFDGIRVATKRSDVKSNWNGDILGEEWGITRWTDITFDQKLTADFFVRKGKRKLR